MAGALYIYVYVYICVCNIFSQTANALLHQMQESSIIIRNSIVPRVISHKTVNKSISFYRPTS